MGSSISCNVTDFKQIRSFSRHELEKKQRDNDKIREKHNKAQLLSGTDNTTNIGDKSTQQHQNTPEKPHIRQTHERNEKWKRTSVQNTEDKKLFAECKNPIT